ncbi:VanW family protein [Paenibacillus daejeonensis]|uniref:VanW family protein n=1 Tax=Paenibacillus daejeonensis TaxID=135193 RepID=UPI0012F8BA68|nr:VanW family protein [Paenibacillus daejeonensis]
MLHVTLTTLNPYAVPSEEWQLELPDGQLIEIKEADYSLPGLHMLDVAKLDKLMGSIAERVYVAAENARIAPDGSIRSERVGTVLDVGHFYKRFAAHYYREGDHGQIVPTPIVKAYPRVDRELLAAIREKPIGYYATYFNSRNAKRSHNIDLAAKAIDGAVVFPGELFSFNRTVGIRTRDRGYKEAPIIVRGELSEGVGGGICQVSSTLYNAVDRAGLTIIERYSHSKRVPYVLAGRDATVSWGGPDFSFRNDYNQPVLIKALSIHGKMYVTVYSSELIEYKPREVPGMSKTKLPEEESVTTTRD